MRCHCSGAGGAELFLASTGEDTLELVLKKRQKCVKCIHFDCCQSLFTLIESCSLPIQITCPPEFLPGRISELWPNALSSEIGHGWLSLFKTPCFKWALPR